jgi:hypothetical protein
MKNASASNPLECKSAHWFERNPKKTVVFLVLAFFLLMLFGTEKLLALRSPIKKKGIPRYIRLREYPPFFAGQFIPAEDDLLYADNLVRKAYPFQIDANGFIMPSKIHQKPDLTMIFLGGSTTACHFVGEKNRFAYLAGHLLEKETGLKINSYNSGVGGSYSLHSINILVNKGIPLKPDIAIMLHNINDLTILMYEESYYHDEFKKGATSNIVVFKPALTTKNLIDHLSPHVYQGMKDLERNIRRTFFPKKHHSYQKDELAYLRGKKIIINQPVILKEFEMNLQMFINICRARHITPVLMTMENRLKETPDPLIKLLTDRLQQQADIAYRDYKGMFDRFNQAIRDLGIKNNVLVINLARQIPQEKAYMYDLVHFTDKGSRLAAGVISADLRPVVEKIAKEKKQQ